MVDSSRRTAARANTWPYQVASEEGNWLGDPYTSVKRGMDVVLALTALVVFGPLMIVLTVLIRCDGGPALFRQERIGLHRQRFQCLKFRSMVRNAEDVLQRTLERDPAAREEWESVRKLRSDPRITPVGRFLRSTSLDELPQLFNVLAGDMSLVGPRPIVEAEVERYGALFFYYTQCKPGLTGLWQVSGRSDVSYESRVRLDEAYFHNRSIVSDIVILCRTPAAVISRHGAH